MRPGESRAARGGSVAGTARVTTLPSPSVNGGVCQPPPCRGFPEGTASTSPPHVNVVTDVSHANGQVTGLSGAGNLEEALKDSTIVVIPAGVPRKPGMSRDDLFNTNASIVKALAEVRNRWRCRHCWRSRRYLRISGFVAESRRRRAPRCDADRAYVFATFTCVTLPVGVTAVWARRARRRARRRAS